MSDHTDPKDVRIAQLERWLAQMYTAWNMGLEKEEFDWPEIRAAVHRILDAEDEA